MVEPLDVSMVLGFLVVANLANLVGTFYVALNLLKKIRVVSAKEEEEVQV